VIHSLVDQILSDETYLLELTALKQFDDYTFVHSVDVSIYAITVGLRMGFTRPMLAELGFAAMFHDIGKTKIPVDLLNKPSGLQSADWELMHEHPVIGAKLIGKSMSLDRYTARAILVAFEHHKNLDGTGYPYVNRTEKVNLYSRIVAICDFFDAITSGRKYQKNKIRFDEAVAEMLKHSGTKFDQLLLKIFVNVMGVYPTGTLLLLDTDELAIVVSNNPEYISRPRVRLIANKDGPLITPRIADLTARDQDTTRYLRNVSRVVDPDRYNIDISRFVLAE
jgi:HD-GYP domain-containing protein (c-di-GMP phosphodiesterase class II)